ncbi:MAG: hypothetical protein J7452_08070 [Thermoflexus sp.]|jgi:hypothetical protein|nr:hypothetical protein [Thermoflexus sp.]
MRWLWIRMTALAVRSMLLVPVGAAWAQTPISMWTATAARLVMVRGTLTTIRVNGLTLHIGR